jgi:hypothetical protein
MVPRAWGPVFMFCAPRLIFGVNEGIGTRFHVLRALTHFRRYRGRRVPFECFGRPDSFSTVSRASGPVFMLCAPGSVFGDTEDVGSRFHVLRDRTHFRRYRGRRVLFLVLRIRTRFRRYRERRVLFSCYAPRTRCRAVTRATGPVFMLCAHGRVFGGNEGVGSRFHVLRSRTNFRP